MRIATLSLYTVSLLSLSFLIQPTLAHADSSNLKEKSHKRLSFSCNYQRPTCEKGSHIAITGKNEKGCYVLECQANRSAQEKQEDIAKKREKLQKAIERRGGIKKAAKDKREERRKKIAESVRKKIDERRSREKDEPRNVGGGSGNPDVGEKIATIGSPNLGTGPTPTLKRPSDRNVGGGSGNPDISLKDTVSGSKKKVKDVAMGAGGGVIFYEDGTKENFKNPPLVPETIDLGNKLVKPIYRHPDGTVSHEPNKDTKKAVRKRRGERVFIDEGGLVAPVKPVLATDHDPTFAKGEKDKESRERRPEAVKKKFEDRKEHSVTSKKRRDYEEFKKRAGEKIKEFHSKVKERGYKSFEKRKLNSKEFREKTSQRNTILKPTAALLKPAIEKKEISPKPIE